MALQLASQQFSPRLLREFTRDRVIKVVLCVQVGTFVFTTTVLRYVRADQPVPDIAMVDASGLAVLLAVLAFITHMVRMLRVDTMMRTVHDETEHVIEMFYPPYCDDAFPREVHPDGDADVAEVRAVRSGFVTAIDVEALRAAARREQVTIVVEVRAGDHVVRGTPIATARGVRGRADQARRAGSVVRRAVRLGYERTMEQDAAYGFRQLADIAVKALSPSINDPVTAAHAVGHLTDLLMQLTGHRLSSTMHQDADGGGRVLVPDRDFPYYLDLACGQVRRYGAAEPTALAALLRMVRDVALAARDDSQPACLAEQTDLILASACPLLPARDLAQLKEMAERVQHALDGNARAAYRPRRRDPVNLSHDLSSARAAGPEATTDRRRSEVTDHRRRPDMLSAACRKRRRPSYSAEHGARWSGPLPLQPMRRQVISSRRDPGDHTTRTSDLPNGEVDGAKTPSMNVRPTSEPGSAIRGATPGQAQPAADPPAVRCCTAHDRDSILVMSTCVSRACSGPARPTRARHPWPELVLRIEVAEALADVLASHRLAVAVKADDIDVRRRRAHRRHR